MLTINSRQCLTKEIMTSVEIVTLTTKRVPDVIYYGVFDARMIIEGFNKTIMGLDMLVESMKILKLAMGKAPCLCFCYVLNF